MLTCSILMAFIINTDGKCVYEASIVLTWGQSLGKSLILTVTFSRVRKMLEFEYTRLNKMLDFQHNLVFNSHKHSCKPKTFLYTFEMKQSRRHICLLSPGATWMPNWKGGVFPFPLRIWCKPGIMRSTICSQNVLWPLTECVHVEGSWLTVVPAHQRQENRWILLSL